MSRRPGRPPALKKAREARLILEEAHWDALQNEAEKRGISVSALVRQIAAEWLEKNNR